MMSGMANQMDQGTKRAAGDERAAAKCEDDRVGGFVGKGDVRDGEPDAVPDGEPEDQMFVAQSLALNTTPKPNNKTSCSIS